MIDIVIVDDHQAMLDTLRLWFEFHYSNEVKILGCFNRGDQFLESLRRAQPQVLLLDMHMPDSMSGYDIAGYVRENHPEIAILVFTSRIDAKSVRECLALGVKGIIEKDRPIEDTLEALRKVANGEIYLSQKALRYSVEALSPAAIQQQSNKSLAELTLREKEIVRWIAKGMTSKEVAEKLHMSHHTVEKHRQIIMQKWNCNKMTSVIQLAIKNGIIDV